MEKHNTSPLIHPELAQYLKSRPVISPGIQTLKDSSLLWGITGAAASSLAIVSGMNEPLHLLMNADANWFRAAQGIAAVANTGIATGLIAIGRHQTYTDLRDLQIGHPPEIIVDRADFGQKGCLSRAFNWAMANTHNIVAVVSLPLCGLMVSSGILSGRPGEAISGLLLTASYVARLAPETYGRSNTKIANWFSSTFNKVAAHQPLQAVKAVINQPPLALSAMIMAWRVMPAMVNAVVEKDWYITGMYGMSLMMMTFLANTTKDAIGRYNGSILSAENKNNDKVVEALLEGRLLKSLKPSMPKPP